MLTLTSKITVMLIITVSVCCVGVQGALEEELGIEDYQESFQDTTRSPKLELSTTSPDSTAESLIPDFEHVDSEEKNVNNFKELQQDDSAVDQNLEEDFERATGPSVVADFIQKEDILSAHAPNETFTTHEILNISSTPVPPTSSTEEPLCYTFQCLKMSEYFEKPMNRQANLCSDFETYTCGRWHEIYRIPDYLSSWGNYEKEQYHLYLIASQVMQDQAYMESQFWDLLKTAKIAYQSCMNLEAIELQSYKAFKEEIEEKITGYPLGEHYWRKSYFKPNKMIANVIQLMGESALMKIHLEETAGNIPDIVHIELGDPILPPEEFEKVRETEDVLNDHDGLLVRKYFEMIYLSSCALRDADKEFDEKYRPSSLEDLPVKLSSLRELEEAILEKFHDESEKLDVHEILPPARFRAGENITKTSRSKRGILDNMPSFKTTMEKNKDCEDRSDMTNNLFEMESFLSELRLNYSGEPPRIMRYSELKTLTLALVDSVAEPRMNLIKFEEIFEHLFGDDPEFIPQDYIFKVDVALLEALKFQKMGFYDDGRTLANLLASHVFVAFSQHLSIKFRTFVDEFHNFSRGINKTVPRRLFCGKMLSDYLPMVIASQVYAKGPNKQEKLALEMLEQRIWESIQSKINYTTQWAYQTPDWLYDCSTIDKFYEGLNSSMMHPKHYLKNLVTLSKFHAKSLLRRRFEYKHWMPDKIMKLTKFHELSTIRDIPSTLLRKPFLSLLWLPNFGNFGGLGWILVQKELSRFHAKNLEPIDVLLDALGRAKPTRGAMENIPGFAALNERQLLLHYLARTWGCGSSKGLLPSEEDKVRKEIFNSIKDAVRREWDCERV